MVRDKYRIDAFLATGSMANVYAATHRNGSRVALKILHREMARDPAMTERFKREGYFANTIGHPGVIRAIDDDVDEEGCPFIVMELLDGENLEERRKRVGGKLPLVEILQYADTILDVLAAAHDAGILHRDLKPENVYVTRSNEVKLLDFGVARWNDGASSSDMTAMGMVLGTPAFMPPEQALGRRDEVDARSDIWGLGATLFTVLTGESVHTGSDAKAKLIATARTAARPLQEVAPEIPRAVAQVIDRALAFDREDRWEDARSMREALRWARMSVERHEIERNEIAETISDSIPAPLPTRRGVGHESDGATEISRRIDEVFTSAPPLTERDEVESLALSSEGPTLAYRRTVEPSPTTERIPTRDKLPTENHDHGPAEFSGLKAEPQHEEPARMSGPQSSTRPHFPSPRPAAGAPPDPPSLNRTLPGVGIGPAPPMPATMAAALAPTLPYVPVSPVPPPAQTSSAPPAMALQMPSAPPPGPLLATIAPRRTSAAKIVLPLVLAIAAGLVAYLLVMRHKSPVVAKAPVEAPSASAAIASASIAPSASTPPSAAAAAAATAPPIATSVAEPASVPVVDKPAASATPRPKRRPRARPAATPAGAAVTEPTAVPATAEVPSEPPPAPTSAPPAPAPAPEPESTALPKKVDPSPPSE